MDEGSHATQRRVINGVVALVGGHVLAYHGRVSVNLVVAVGLRHGDGCRPEEVEYGGFLADEVAGVNVGVVGVLKDFEFGHAEDDGSMTGRGAAIDVKFEALGQGLQIGEAGLDGKGLS